MVRMLVNTPYDDVFRTLLNDCSSLIIPIVNEIFHESYSGDEAVELYPNQHFINGQDGKERERITDSCFGIRGRSLKKYHIECQSTSDDTMLVRMFEYDAQIALDAGEVNDGVLTVRFPASAILYLRCRATTPDVLTVRIELPGGRSAAYDIPAMKAQRYTPEEIFSKGLLFLIPFHIFAHEGRFVRYERDEGLHRYVRALCRCRWQKFSLSTCHLLQYACLRFSVIIETARIIRDSWKNERQVHFESVSAMNQEVRDETRCFACLMCAHAARFGAARGGGDDVAGFVPENLGTARRYMVR